MKPKTITAKIVVPEWAKWVATDADGQLCFFSHKPKIDSRVDDAWAPNVSTGSEWENSCLITPPLNWRKTLRRVK